MEPFPGHMTLAHEIVAQIRLLLVELEGPPLGMKPGSEDHSSMDWATCVDKFNAVEASISCLDAKIGRVEQLERSLGFIATELKALTNMRDKLNERDKKLDNVKRRLSILERVVFPPEAPEPKTLAEVFSQEADQKVESTDGQTNYQ